jgi:tetratricopeptide (TPR) repeat protein
MEALNPGVLENLLACGNERALAEAVLAHVTPGKIQLDIGIIVTRFAETVETMTAETGAGFDIALRGPVAHVIGGPVHVDDCTLYLIDRPLLSAGLLLSPSRLQCSILANSWASNARRAMVRPASPPPELLSGEPAPSMEPPSMAPPPSPTESSAQLPRRSWTFLFSRAVYRVAVALPGTRWLAHRALPMYLAIQRRQSDGPEITVAARSSLRKGSWMFAKRRVRPVVRFGYRVMLALPPTRPFARWAATNYFMLRRRAVSAAEQASPPLTAASWTEEATPQPIVFQAEQATLQPATVSKAEQATAVAVFEGVQAAQPAAFFGTELAEAQPKVSAKAIDKLRDIRAARVVLNIAEVLRVHRDQVTDLVQELPPLTAVEACLQQTGISDERLVTELGRLLEMEPGFAEAWLELGYVHLDRGNYAAAEACFDQSIAMPPSLSPVEGRIDCGVQAAFAKASALEARGKLPAAAAAYANALALENRAGMAHVAYGKVLRRLGRVREALPEFEAGMETDLTALGLETLPRRFSELNHRLMARFSLPNTAPSQYAVSLTD